VLADAGRPTAQHAFAVGGGGEDAVARCLATGMLSPVSIASLTLDAPSITSPSTGTLSPGTDDEDIARDQQAGIELDQLAVALDARHLRLQATSASIAAVVFALAGFQQLAEQNSVITAAEASK
jgi:hypothetical protein